MDPLPVVVMGTLALDTVATVDRLPGPDEAARVLGRDEEAGGAGANVAVGLARLGLPPRLLTAVGRDFAGSAYEARLRELGVDLSGAVVAEAPTSHAYLFSGPAGRQQIYYDPGASPAMARCTVPAGFRGLAHFAPGELAAYPGLMAGLPLVTLDPGQEVFHRPVSEVAACFPHAHVLFVNRHERARLEAELGDLRGLLDQGLRALVTTLGARGAHVETPDEVLEVEAVPATARDPSGAGDAHRAGFLFGMAHDLGWLACARLASVVAASAVEAVGTQQGLPTLPEARARYKSTWGEAPF